MSQRKATPALTSVFAALYRTDHPLTKQEVARETGLSLPTVYQALTGLEELDLLEAGDERRSTGGRRASTLAIRAAAAGALGISITGNHLRVIACDLHGKQIDRLASTSRLRGPISLDELKGALREAVDQGVSALEENGTRTIGVGIAVPSAIDPSTGRLLNTGVLRITDPSPTAASITRGISLPVAVFNDANCGGFSEVFPAHEGQNLAYLSLERGVGGAIIIGGRPYEGEGGASAEFGHICVEPGGRECTCGRRGCLEAYCSSARLSDEMDCTLDEFFSRLDAREPAAVEAFADYAEHLVRGIQTIRTIFDCDVVLGGFMAPRLSPYFDYFSERVRLLDPLRGKSPFLRYARHPHHGVPLGAAQQMVQRYVESL